MKRLALAAALALSACGGPVTYRGAAQLSVTCPGQPAATDSFDVAWQLSRSSHGADLDMGACTLHFAENQLAERSCDAFLWSTGFIVETSTLDVHLEGTATKNGVSCGTRLDATLSP